MSAQRIIGDFCDQCSQRLIPMYRLASYYQVDLTAVWYQLLLKRPLKGVTTNSKCWTVAEDEDNPHWKAAELVASTLDMEHHQEIIQTEDADTWVTDMSWHEKTPILP